MPYCCWWLFPPFLHSDKEKSEIISPQAFLACFQKALWAVWLLDHYFEKELVNVKDKVSFFYSFPKEHINNYIHHGNCDYDSKILEDLKIFFQGHYNANPPKQPDQCNNQGQASCCNHTMSTPCDSAPDTTTITLVGNIVDMLPTCCDVGKMS